MLTQFRHRARAIAAILLVAVAPLGLPHSFNPHHDDDHHVVRHDASTHRIGSFDSDQDQHPLHCLACHWVRSLRLRSATVDLAEPHYQSAKLHHWQISFEADGRSLVQPPLRAPPASPAVV